MLDVTTLPTVLWPVCFTWRDPAVGIACVIKIYLIIMKAIRNAQHTNRLTM